MMFEDWLAMISNMNGTMRDLRQVALEVMKTFFDMARAADCGEALDGKTKELVALSIGVTIRSAPWMAYQAESAVRQGASPGGINEALAMAA
jgi:alkylhydroperoxidase/carboxymuconolactone decarboxylase family protein YurZ